MSLKRIIVKVIVLSCLLLTQRSYSQPNLTIVKSKAKEHKKGDPIDFRMATSIAGTAFMNVLDVPDIDKLSSSSGQENYETPDAYFIVTFQKAGNPLFIGHVYPNGKIKYLFKMAPIGNTKQEAISKEEAGKIGMKFLTEKLGASTKLYSMTSVEKEKAAKGILAYYLVKIKRLKPSKDKLAVDSMELKIHPKSREIMSAAFTY